MIRVKEILNKKRRPTNVVRPGDLVIDALVLLNSVNLSYLIVMEGDQYKGIFCERDYCRNVILKGRSSKTSTVEEVMTTDLPVVEASDTAEYCMHTMNQHKTRYLLALNDAGFAGIVTIHDLLRQVLSNREDVFDHSLAESLIAQEEGDKIF
ncbi:MAG: CBS domain-containing protein [Chitinophagaceae bacterium]|nr:CBS domain-containing protein [Chitinophagaceae bacterium]